MDNLGWLCELPFLLYSLADFEALDSMGSLNAPDFIAYLVPDLLHNLFQK